MRFKRLLKPGEFTRNVITLVSAAGIAQAIPLLASPVISRLYTPESVGVFALFGSIVNIMMLLSTGRYERAIVLPKQRENAWSLIVLCIALNVVVSLTLLLIVTVFPKTIISFFGIEQLEGFLPLVPLATCLFGLFFTFSYALNRSKAFKAMAHGNIANSGAMAGAQLGLFKLEAAGLIASLVIARGVAIILYANSAIKRCYTRMRWVTLYGRLRAMMSRYQDFPKFALPQAFINTLSASLPLLLLGNYFTADITGQYGWAFRLIQAPITLIAAATYQVFYQEASERYNRGESLEIVVRKLYKRLFLIGIIPYLVLLLFAPVLFSVVFGAQWETAGWYATYLTPWYFMIFLNTPIMALIYILNKQKVLLYMEVLLLIARFLALYIGYVMGSPEISIISYGAVGFCYHIILWRMFIGLSKIRAAEA